MRSSMFGLLFLIIMEVSCQTPKQRAQDLLNKMSSDQKFAMVHGYGGSYVGDVNAIDELGIPALHLEDGPQGVADGVQLVTAWPSALTVVASWNTTAMEKYGEAMGQEQLGKGTNIMLGPMINLARVPQGGRNFESFGEDPFLASAMVRSSVKGIQSTGVMACAKHYVDNNQENNRGSVSENVPQRAQYELYYQAFKASIDAGVGSLMCSYNKINNTYACENPQTFAYVRNELGYEGFTMSDWGATHSTVNSANAGLDMEMPGQDFFGSGLQQAVSNGSVPQSRVDDMVLRILTSMYAVGIMDRSPSGDINANVRSTEHDNLARELAIAGTVLLKNLNGILPLDETKLTSIAVLGDDANDHAIATGGGSGGVVLPYLVTPLAGIQTRLGYTRPVNCTYEQNIDYYQPGNPYQPGNSPQECCTICTNSPGCNYFTYTSDNKCWLKQTNEGRKDADGLTSGACAPPIPGKVTVTYGNSQDLNNAANIAKSAQVAIVFVGTSSSEGSDRSSLSLDAPSDDLVNAVIAAQPNTIVVAHNPGAVTMPWASRVPAIISAFLPGQEDGNAIASILFGDSNPSGRLPLSFPNNESDTWLQSTDQYPGVNGQANYSENLQMGYRWYASQNTKPLWSFGYGLSYTSFNYSDFTLSGSPTSAVTVNFKVTNTGSRPGAEVPQVYVTFPTSASEPPEQLKGFTKIFLQPQASATVTVTINSSDFQIWDVIKGGWATVAGSYSVYVGPYWGNYPLKGTVTL